MHFYVAVTADTEGLEILGSGASIQECMDTVDTDLERQIIELTAGERGLWRTVARSKEGEWVASGSPSDAGDYEYSWELTDLGRERQP